MNNKTLQFIMRIAAGYGVIQILAQDLGIKSNKTQKDLVQFLPIQLFIMYSSAYIMLQDHKETLIILTIYYFIKMYFS